MDMQLLAQLAEQRQNELVRERQQDRLAEMVVKSQRQARGGALRGIYSVYSQWVSARHSAPCPEEIVLKQAVK